MDEQMTKTELIATLQTKRAEWDAVLAEVPEAQLDELGVAGEWSVKDIVAHITYHERWFADRMHEVLQGQAYTPTEMDRMPFDERNERIYQQNRNRPAAEVLAESRQVFQRLIDGAQAHSEDFLIEPQQFEGAPEPVAVWQLLRGDVYEHYGDHIPSVRSWLARRRS